MKQNKKNKTQNKYQSQISDFFNYTIVKETDCETIVLFNQFKGCKKNLSTLDDAIYKTQNKPGWNIAKYW